MLYTDDVDTQTSQNVPKQLAPRAQRAVLSEERARDELTFFAKINVFVMELRERVSERCTLHACALAHSHNVQHTNTKFGAILISVRSSDI